LGTLGDITGSRELQRDISMIIPFRYREDMKDSELITVVAADLGKSAVESIKCFGKILISLGNLMKKPFKVFG
jgi:hypothetical protein